MKLYIAVLLIALPYFASAQNNTLPAAVYSPSAKKENINKSVQKTNILSGQTLDLREFSVYTLTLATNASYDRVSNAEQLIIIKTGNIQVTVNDTAKTYGPNSIALILPGDKVGFKNETKQPVTWFVLTYQSTNPADSKRGHNAGPSFIKEWNTLKVSSSTKSDVRAAFDRPTNMFGRFEVHATSLNPGYASHDPHTHRAEEVILMLSGEVQEHIGTEKYMAKAGDCIYLSSGVLHGPKNIGSVKSTYYAIQWHGVNE